MVSRKARIPEGQWRDQKLLTQFLKMPSRSIYREIERESLHTHQTEGKQE